MNTETITLEETKIILGQLCAIYKNFTVNDYGTWYKLFNRIGATQNQVEEAALAHISTSKYPPLPADLIIHIKDNRR